MWDAFGNPRNKINHVSLGKIEKEITWNNQNPVPGSCDPVESSAGSDSCLRYRSTAVLNHRLYSVFVLHLSRKTFINTEPEAERSVSLTPAHKWLTANCIVAERQQDTSPCQKCAIRIPRNLKPPLCLRYRHYIVLSHDTELHLDTWEVHKHLTSSL